MRTRLITSKKSMEPILSQTTDFVILDLSGLTFISSAGIRALMYVHKTAATRETKVIFTNLQPQIAKVMETIKQLPGLYLFKNDQEMDESLAAIQEEVLRKKG